MHFFYVANILIFGFFGLLAITHTFLLIVAAPDIITRYKESKIANAADLMKDIELPPVSILVPMYNEEARILNCVKSILRSDYPNIEIILINDSSTDSTLEVLKSNFVLKEVPNIVNEVLKTTKILQIFKSTEYPITLINKQHGHSADSLNVGLNASHSPLYLTLDADTIIEPDAISKMVFHMLSQPHCISVGGALYVLNNNEVKDGVLLDSRIPRKDILPAVQALEYIRSFVYGRSGWNFFGGALCYSGAFTFFEKQAVMEIGGYDRQNYAYDVNILLALHERMLINKYPYKVNYTPSPAAWTEVPDTVKRYWKQRQRWHLGTMRSFMNFKRMLFNPRYGIIGFFNYPFYWLFEILGPVIECVSYILLIIAFILDFITPTQVVWLVLLAWGFISILSITIMILNNITFHKYNKNYDTIVVFLLVIVEMFGVRQIRAACAFYATLKYIVYPRSRHI